MHKVYANFQYISNSIKVTIKKNRNPAGLLNRPRGTVSFIDEKDCVKIKMEGKKANLWISFLNKHYAKKYL
jgi:hypothetical protein